MLYVDRKRREKEMALKGAQGDSRINSKNAAKLDRTMDQPKAKVEPKANTSSKAKKGKKNKKRR